MEKYGKREQGAQITVIGAGKFGSAIAEIISRDGTPTTLVTRSHSRLEGLRERFAKHPPSLSIQTLEKATLGEYVFLALPSSDFPEIISKLALRHHTDTRRNYTSLSKGLTAPDGKTPFELLSSTFGEENCAVASGPSLAGEMARHTTHLVVASHDDQLRAGVADILSTRTTVCEQSADPRGIEFAGIAKNVAALGFHACRRATGSLNIAGPYASHLFNEMYEYAAEYGARPKSFMGVAGIGDLLTTSHADTSRNVQAGRLLGDKADMSTSDIETEVKQVVESLHTVPLFLRRIRSEVPPDDMPAVRLLGQRIIGELSRDEWAATLA